MQVNRTKKSEMEFFQVLIVFMKIFCIYGVSNVSSKIYIDYHNSILSNVKNGELETLGEVISVWRKIHNVFGYELQKQSGVLKAFFLEL